MGLMNKIDNLCEIGDKAEKEFNIECMLKEMYGMWEKINFVLKDYKGISHIVSGCVDI